MTSSANASAANIESPKSAPAREPAAPADTAWDQVLRALNRAKGKRYVLGPLLRGSTSHEVVESELRIHFAHLSNADRMEEELGDAGGKKAVEDAVAAAFGVQLSVKAVHGAGGDATDSPGAPTDSPLVRAAMAMGARIIEDSAENGESS